MKVLILGGTEFVGRALVDEALARGWDVSTFTRGTHPSQPGVTSLIGDRREPLAFEGEWDLVVDTWSEEPRAVLTAATALRGRAGHFSYISTRSVYSGSAPGDDAPVVDADPDDASGEVYARAKRGGELAALQAFGDSRTTIARPGCIFGPWENTARLPWWLNRAARGGDILAPGPAAASVQYIDARDLAAFALDAVPGVFNTVGTTTMGALLGECMAVTGSTGRLRWFEPREILDAGIEPWTELPAWLPPGETRDALHGGDASRAIDAGLRIRPLVDTVTDTWAWLAAGEVPGTRRRYGLDPAKEAAFLASR